MFSQADTVECHPRIVIRIISRNVFTRDELLTCSRVVVISC